MTEENKNEERTKISKHDFYFETPLYENIALEALEEGSFGGDVDAYSAKNHSETTYNVKIEGIDTWGVRTVGLGNYKTIGFYLITLTCKRKEDDVLRFTIFKDAEIVFKIGQYPSLADLQFAEIGKKYDKVLPSDDLKNLKKAIGLASHGAGAGSFVYLRRIFEKLIFETYKNNAEVVGVPEADFTAQRMMDKIETLKAFLPSQLVEMKAIYSILSNGVHELSEEECLQYFSPIKLSIELILDQKIEEVKKQQKNSAVKREIQKIQQKMANERKPD